MRHARIASLLATFIISLNLSAQTLNTEPALDLGVSSPTAASLGKFGDIPVSLYTGTPNISIPLFEIKGRDLRLPITLNYHASGVKIEEIPGWVGLGWALDAGGAITRTVRDIVDDSQYGYLVTGPQLAANWLAPSEGFKLSVLARLIDAEPDIFFYNFAGRTGKFVFNTDGTIHVIPYQKWRIDKTVQSYEIKIWTITTEDGMQYIFRDRETTQDEPGEPPTSRTYTSTWYLSAIKSAAGTDSIQFKYKNNSPGPLQMAYQNNTYFEEFDAAPGSSAGPCTPTDRQFINSYSITAIRLDSIKSALHTVKFATSLRDDAKNSSTQQEHKLDSLTIKSRIDGTVAREIKFQYGYFSNGVAEARRLRLDAVTEKGSDGAKLPPYKFDYDLSQDLPSRYSYAIDHWGFWNGKFSNTTPVPAYNDGVYNLTGADREPDPAYLQPVF